MPTERHNPAHAFIAIGSNLGDRRATIRSAIGAISRLPTTTAVETSPIVETEPVGPVPQGRFLNAVVHVSTALEPRVLLDNLLAIEAAHGRDRSRERRWGPRTLDLDILVYADAIIDEPGLTIPHPRLHERPFVLGPLSAIAPDLVIPGLDRSVRDLLSAVRAEAHASRGGA